MKPSGSQGGTRRLLIRAGYALALLVGGSQGYLFGAQLGGVMLGAIMAVNGALFCALLVGSVASWLTRKSLPAPDARRSGAPPRGRA